MNQSLFYQVNLISINQVEGDSNISGILERLYGFFVIKKKETILKNQIYIYMLKMLQIL